MHFCVKCDNMYYLKLNEDDPNKLIYYCRHCGDEANNLTAEDMCVLKLQVKRNEEKYIHVMNEYTKLDPTLPRIKTLECPNAECRKKAESDIIYIRYDDVNIKYVYMCKSCDTTWKTNLQN